MQVFEQTLVAREPGVMITLVERSAIERPALVDGAPILEPASPAVWFSFDGAAHDIGRFHRANGTFTGIYGNLITPVEGLDGTSWSTTDLFLDVWLPAAGGVRLLDEDELDEALARGWIDDATARGARAEAERIMREAAAGTWPPEVVGRWTLERVRSALRHLSDADV